MSSSELPVVVQAATTLLQNPQYTTSAGAMQQLADWGFAQIDAFYQPDPLRRPLDGMKRMNARREWTNALRTQGKSFRGIVVKAQVDQLLQQVRLEMDRVIWEEQERRRQILNSYDANLRIAERREMTAIELDAWTARENLMHQHQMEMQGGMQEHELRRLAAGASQLPEDGADFDQRMEKMRRINAEISRIRSDPSLTSEQRHVEIEAWQRAMPQLLANPAPLPTVNRALPARRRNE